MNEDIFERLRQEFSRNGQVSTEDVEKMKQAANGVKVPMISSGQRVWTPGIPVPEIKPASNDRRDKRDAKEVQRELAQIVAGAAKAGVALQAVRSVNTYVVYSVDQAQEDMMAILYSRKRHEGMNELVASVISQCLQLDIAQSLAVAEHHFKRLMEKL